MICPKCKVENVDGSKYCYACSYKFDVEKKHSKEDKISRSIASMKYLSEYYCPLCGIKVTSKKPCIICKNPSGFAFKNYFNKVCEEFYSSNYYQCTGYNFEDVISDKGKVGEYILEKTVHYLRYNNITNYKLLFNLCVPEPNGLFQEVDAVLILGRYIFVYEIKNRSGDIFCNNFNDNEWFQRCGTEVYSLYNPIKQNEEHRSALIHYLKDNNISTNIVGNVVTVGCESSYIGDCFEKMDASHRYMYPSLLLDYTKYNYIRILYPLIRTIYQSRFDTLYGMVDTAEMDEESKKENRVIASHYASQVFLEDNEDIYECLKRLTYIDESKRKLYFSEREYRKEQSQKREYRYFYLGNDKERNCINNLVVRTNNVYYQYREKGSSGWMDACTYSSNFDDVTWKCGAKSSDYKYKYELVSPMEIVRAYRCIEEGSFYIPDSKGIIEGIE